jgi:ATP-dependent protease ClpP protease subunit
MLFRTKQQLTPCFRAQLQADGTLEVLIYDEIGANFWTGDGITDKDIKRQIDEADPKKVLVCINSPGGDAFQGIGIYGVLKNCGRPVSVRVDGIAASAASIIAMAGDDIEMGPQSLMMIHRAWGMVAGYASDMRSTANALDQISDGIGQAYVQKTKLPLSEIQSMMEAETWMGAQECLDKGFCTKVSDYSNPEALAMAKNFKALAHMKKLPKGLRSNNANDPAAPDGTPCNCPCENCRMEACTNCINSACDDEQCDNCPMQAKAKAKAPKADSDGNCQCNCDNCVANKCSDCTNRDCLDKSCKDCPMQGSQAPAVPTVPSPQQSADDECHCDCDACTAGNCDQCDNPDCTDPNCDGCPMQASLGNKARRLDKLISDKLAPEFRNGAIASHSTATSDKAWDHGANEKRLKADQPASYYRKWAAWVDPDKDATTKAAYKFGHHEVSADGDIGAANVKACQSIIGNLNGGRSKPDIPDSDRRGVYNHAARHIRDAGEEPAPLKDSFEMEPEEPKDAVNLPILEAELELMDMRRRV